MFSYRFGHSLVFEHISLEGPQATLRCAAVALLSDAQQVNHPPHERTTASVAKDNLISALLSIGFRLYYSQYFVMMSRLVIEICCHVFD